MIFKVLCPEEQSQKYWLLVRHSHPSQIKGETEAVEARNLGFLQENLGLVGIVTCAKVCEH